MIQIIIPWFENKPKRYHRNEPDNIPLIKYMIQQYNVVKCQEIYDGKIQIKDNKGQRIIINRTKNIKTKKRN